MMVVQESTLQCGNCKEYLPYRKFSKFAVKKNLAGHGCWCRKCSKGRVKNILLRLKEKKRRHETNPQWGIGKIRKWEKRYATIMAKANAHHAKRRTSKLHATPQWSDLKRIEAIYAEAQRLTMETGVVHHVDHIVPLQGKNVCGLHVSWNLRAIPALENLTKSNKF